MAILAACAERRRVEEEALPWIYSDQHLQVIKKKKTYWDINAAAV